jgi:hypothetical protein
VVVLDAERVYWTSHLTDVVMSVPKNGGEPTSLASNAGSKPRALACAARRSVTP